MKSKDLIKKLQDAGYDFYKHGGEHDIYRNGEKILAVPRHKEINEITAKKILKQAEIK